MSPGKQEPLDDFQIIKKIAALVDAYYHELTARGIDSDLIETLVLDFSNTRLKAFYSLHIGPTGTIEVRQSPQ
jgi:hypothetical protein